MLIEILTHPFFYNQMLLVILGFMLLILKNGFEATLPPALFTVILFAIALSMAVDSEETLKLKKEIVLGKPIECQGKIIQEYSVKDNFIVKDDMAYPISWPECKKMEKK